MVESLDQLSKEVHSLNADPTSKEITNQETDKSMVANIKPMEIVEGLPDSSVVEQFQQEQTGSAKSGDNYFPIQIGGFGPNTQPQPGALTEEQKRKRMIIFAGSILALLIVLVVVLSKRK